MVSGKILGLSTSLVVLVIAVAIVIRFGSSLNIGQRFNEGLEGASDSITSFFDSLLPSTSAQVQQNVEPLELSQPNQGLPNPANAPTNPTPVDVILADPTKTPAQKRQDIFDRIPADQKKGTDRFDRVFRPDGTEKFNPPNTKFFGLSNINQGKGLASDSQAAKQLEKFLADGNNVSDVSIDSSGVFTFGVESQPFGFPTLPSAFAEEIPQIQGPIQLPSQKELDARSSLTGFVNSQTDASKQSITPKVSNSRLSLDSFMKSILSQKPESKGSNVKGEVKGVSITGVGGGNFAIRPTAIDRSRLLVDENKKPVETASQRANRVFQETNDFVDVKRGATKMSDTKNANKNFGTNTGSGQIGSTAQDTKTNTESLLQREAEKASRIFDAGSISNF